MIDRALLRRLLSLAAILLLLSAGAALVVGRSPKWAGGLLLGFALGAAPYASWSWIVSRGLANLRNRVLAVLLLVLKLGLYAGALYLFVARGMVSPIGVFVGLGAVGAVVGVGALLGTAPPAKGVA